MMTKLFALTCALFLGCAPIQEAVKTVETGARLAQATEPVVAAAYRTQLEMCTAYSHPDDVQPCIQRVQETFEPIRDLYVEFKQQWCQLDRLLGGHRCGSAK